MFTDFDNCCDSLNVKWKLNCIYYLYLLFEFWFKNHTTEEFYMNNESSQNVFSNQSLVLQTSGIGWA